MKYDPYSRSGKVSQRTMNAFYESFMSLLEEKKYDDITVNDICEKADYPRTTFYNYFGCIDNLLIWSFDRLLKNSAIFDSISSKDDVVDHLIDFYESNKEFLDTVSGLNSPESKVFILLRSYLTDASGKKLSVLPHDERIPDDLAGLYYSDVLMLLMRWSFLSRNELTREQAKYYFDILTSSINS